MEKDLIRYDILTQEALRDMLRKLLGEIAQTGLPGEHHFYISFRTTASGIKISNRLLSNYPEEMTIVMQHQFWDLIVSESAFEIGLAFNGIPEKLYIPFNAIKAFYDPSVQFGLQFDPEQVQHDDDVTEDSKLAEHNLLPSEREQNRLAQERNKMDQNSHTVKDADNIEKTKKPTKRSKKKEGADVVSLDAFRKKN